MNRFNFDNLSIGSKIMVIRKSKEMTQAELAGLCNTTQCYISQLEEGRYKRIRFETIQKIANALKVSLDSFQMGDANEPI